jgi:hypothetical protein
MGVRMGVRMVSAPCPQGVFAPPIPPLGAGGQEARAPGRLASRLALSIVQPLPS